MLRGSSCGAVGREERISFRMDLHWDSAHFCFCIMTARNYQVNNVRETQLENAPQSRATVNQQLKVFTKAAWG